MKKKLPVVLNDWINSQAALVTANVKEVEFKLIRPVSQTEVKITIQFILCVKLGQDVIQKDSVLFTFYLRYYDGQWTVMAFHSANNKLDTTSLILAIDQLFQEDK